MGSQNKQKNIHSFQKRQKQKEITFQPKQEDEENIYITNQNLMLKLADKIMFLMGG